MKFEREPGRIFAVDARGELLCEVTFPSSDGTATINRTYVSEVLRGQGVAGQLMEAAVRQIEEQGMQAEPVCSYAVKWFENHPEKRTLLKTAQQ